MNPFLAVCLALTAVAFTIPVFMWFMGDRTPKGQLDPEDFRRAKALPFWGDGEIPKHRDRSLEEDLYGLRAILVLFLRSWPFVRPQLLGHWHIVGVGRQDTIAEISPTDNYSSTYAPLLALLVAFSGPLLGFAPWDYGQVAEVLYDFPSNIFYGLIFTQIIGLFALTSIAVRGTASIAVAVVIGVSAFVTLLMSILVMDGWGVMIYGIMTTMASAMPWFIQFGQEDGVRRIRVRVETHLVFFYALVGLQIVMAIPIGIYTAEILAQSVLQSIALNPQIADFFGRPDLALGVAESLTTADRHYIVRWVYLPLHVMLFAVNLPLELIVPYYRIWIMQRINQSLRLALVERWHKLSINYHADHRTGDSIYRIYQDSAQVTAVIDRLVDLTQNILSRWFVAVFIVFWLSPTIAAMLVSLLVPIFVWAKWAMPRMRTRSLVYRQITSDLVSKIQESFASIRLIKAYGMERQMQEELESESVVAMNSAFQVRKIIALVTVVNFVICACFMISGEFWMATMANVGSPTWANELISFVSVAFVVWGLAAFNYSKEQFFITVGTMRHVMKQWLTAQDMAMGLARVFDILDIEPDVEDKPGAQAFTTFTDQIQFSGVVYRYQEDRPVLDGVEFSVQPGSVTAIVGPTGSGKTTMMSLLLRLFDPNEGRILIDGIDLTDYRVGSLRENIAIALQENVLFSMSVRENIRYVAPTATDQEVELAVRIACMEDFVSDLPQGLDTVLGDRGGKLSTGQRQRLSIARAVVRNTPILVLDEPTAALDASTEHRVLTNLAEWGRGRAIFLITHRISTIRQATNILYLDQGRIIESGSHDELMARRGRYSDFVEAESSHNVSGGQEQ